MNPFSIYFPQFYPTPTNDRAWGQGFTDWALVAQANLYDRWSRRAPRRGFYDGSDPAVHFSQTAEMRAAGLAGMGVYHYWFYTHQELPAFEQTLLGTPQQNDFPWFLIWASESWSRRWIGDPSPIVSLAKVPEQADIETHCRYLLKCFDHPAYFRWQDKPLFVWYHLDHFSDPHRVVEQYRETMRRHGVEIAVGQFLKNTFEFRHSGLTDLSYLFEPRLYFGTRRAGRGSRSKAVMETVERLLGEHTARRLLTLVDRVQQKGHTYPADDFLEYLRSDERARLVASLSGVIQEVISPGWNNTPRYDARFTALQDVPTEQFGELTRSAAARVASLPPLINAWNEWSEGAAVEPCAYYGTRYLDALTRAGAVAPCEEEPSQGARVSSEFSKP